MAKTIVRTKRVVRRDWTRAEVKELKQHSKNKTRVKTISKALKRTPGRSETKSPCARNPARSLPHKNEVSLNSFGGSALLDARS